MTATYCENCGTPQRDANIKFCASCGSPIARISPPAKANNAISDMSAVKAKLKIPAIGMIVSAGINIPVFLFLSMWLGDVSRYQSEPAIFRAMQAVCILFLLALGFSIYGAVQMMNTTKHGFAVTSAIINILTILCGVPIGLPFGIWALVVLQKTEIKAAFARNTAV